MKKQYYLIATIVALIVVATFTLQNTEEMMVKALFWDFTASKALVMFGLFSLGIIYAMLLLSPTIFALRKKLKKDEKLIDELEQSGAKNTTE